MNKLLLSLFLAGALSCFGQTSGTSSADQSGSSASDQNTSHAKHHPKGAAASTKGGSDAVFVKKAAQGGMAEVELGKLAAEKASNDDVKQFGQKMVDDHSKANDQLKQIASQKSLDVPSEVSPKDKAVIDRLSKLSGPAFDRAYMKHMVMDHTKDAAEFKREANSGSDQDIKGFATSTLSTIQDHLKMAKDINSKMSTQGKMSKKTTQKPS